jgi:hypothetical protein
MIKCSRVKKKVGRPTGTPIVRSLLYNSLVLYVQCIEFHTTLG